MSNLERLCLLHRYLSVLCSVFLVTDEDDYDIRLSLAPHLLKPSLQVPESIHPRDIVRQHHAMRPLVKDLGNGLEVLLTSCVPNLKAENLLIQLDHE